MTQVIRKTSDLIVNSLYMIGELGVNETPDAFMERTGIELINEILDNFSVDNIYIPYLTTLTFDFVGGQATYTFSDIVTADVNTDRIIDLVFANYTVSDQITYPLDIVSKANYYEMVRLQAFQTRPAICFLNKQAADSEVTFYPAPDQAYSCSLKVKRMLDSLSLEEDLDGLPPYYYGLLKAALARKFLMYYPSANWTPQAEQDYQDMYYNLKTGNETDITIRSSGLLERDHPSFWWTNILAL